MTSYLLPCRTGPLLGSGLFSRRDKFAPDTSSALKELVPFLEGRREKRDRGCFSYSVPITYLNPAHVIITPNCIKYRFIIVSHTII